MSLQPGLKEHAPPNITLDSQSSFPPTNNTHDPTTFNQLQVGGYQSHNGPFLSLSTASTTESSLPFTFSEDSYRSSSSGDDYSMVGCDVFVCLLTTDKV
jgi:hypothetical protein